MRIRLKRQRQQLIEVKILGKINGAVGNYNAHFATYPELDWQAFAQDFVSGLGLEWNPYTTQIEPHDYIAELFHALSRFNTVLLDLDRDVWGYISVGYFKTKYLWPVKLVLPPCHIKLTRLILKTLKATLAWPMRCLNFLSAKLPVSRWQRDLTDSTVLRNIGVGIAHSVIAYQSTLKGTGQTGS